MLTIIACLPVPADPNTAMESLQFYVRMQQHRQRAKHEDRHLETHRTLPQISRPTHICQAEPQNHQQQQQQQEQAEKASPEEHGCTLLAARIQLDGRRYADRTTQGLPAEQRPYRLQSKQPDSADTIAGPTEGPGPHQQTEDTQSSTSCSPSNRNSTQSYPSPPLLHLLLQPGDPKSPPIIPLPPLPPQ
jgi:hypothetical protein